MQAVRIFGTVLTWGGFGVAALGVFGFIGSLWGTGSSDGPDSAIRIMGVAAAGFAAFMSGMFLSDAGKTSRDFKKERKAGKTTCSACGTKRRLEDSCPKCGAPPSSSF